MSGQFRPNREETFNQTISKVLRIITQFRHHPHRAEHHDRSPGNNNGKDQLDIRAKAKQTGTDRNENPRNTAIAPMIPQYREPGDGNGPELRTMKIAIMTNRLSTDSTASRGHNP